MCETVADTTSFEIFSLFVACYFGTYEISIRKNQRGNQEWTTQRHCQHGAHKTKTNKTQKTQHRKLILPFWNVFYVRQAIKTAARDLVLHGIVSQSHESLQKLDIVRQYLMEIYYNRINMKSKEKLKKKKKKKKN